MAKGLLHTQQPLFFGKLYLAKDAVGQFDAVAFLHSAAAQRLVGVGHAPCAVSTFQHYVNLRIGWSAGGSSQPYICSSMRKNFVFHAASRPLPGRWVLSPRPRFL